MNEPRRKSVEARLLELEQSRDALLAYVTEHEKRLKKIEDNSSTLEQLANHDGQGCHVSHH
jgi:hypothetical protein